MSSIRQKLLGWYDDAARDLPWRHTRDPYAIWVSEVMLQQTRVETVVPYYQRFLKHFPTPSALAEADEDAVLSHWSGLGYYRRARLLHAVGPLCGPKCRRPTCCSVRAPLFATLVAMLRA